MKITSKSLLVGTIFFSLLVVFSVNLLSLPNNSPSVQAQAPQIKPKIFAFYYLWWSENHWHNKLGPNYPYDESPLPLPATLDETGCNETNLYPPNQLIDVPAALETHIQDNPGVIENEVRTASSYGLTGFIVNWNSVGTTNYTRRLQTLVDAVNKVNAEGIDFKLWISYKASAVVLDTQQIRTDFSFLRDTYANDPAFDRSLSSKPLLIWQGSRKYDTQTIAQISTEFRNDFFIIGDEHWNTWNSERAQYLDGNSFYWSTQSPYTNPHSFGQLETLAETVRNSGTNPDGGQKIWLAPFTPGYNSILLGGQTCIPRNHQETGDTMRTLFEGNSTSNPQGWTLISWNEIAEGSYIIPMQRWGATYLEILQDIIQNTPPQKCTPEDLNNDTVVNSIDFAQATNYLFNGNFDGDVNNDGVLDIRDLLQVIDRYGFRCRITL